MDPQFLFVWKCLRVFIFEGQALLNRELFFDGFSCLLNFSTLTISSCCLVVSMIPDEILAFRLIEDNLHIMSCFSFADFKIPSLVFATLVMVCLSEFIYLSSLLNS